MADLVRIGRGLEGMATTVNVHVARTHLSRFLDELPVTVEDGPAAGAVPRHHSEPCRGRVAGRAPPPH